MHKDPQLIKTEHKFELAYSESGVGESMLMVHGFGMNKHSWDYIIPYLDGYKIIAIDLKGFGKSPKPFDGKYSVIDQRDLLVAFIQQKKLFNLTLVGHSMGGVIALLTALELRQIGECDQLKSLILIDSIGYAQEVPNFIKVLQMPLLGFVLMNTISNRMQVKSVLNKAYYDKSKIPDALVAAYVSNLTSNGGKYALSQTAQKLVYKEIEKYCSKLSIIKTPTLLIWGKHDCIVPIEVGEKLNMVIPNSKLVLIKNCGHSPHEEQPEETAKIIREFMDTKI